MVIASRGSRLALRQVELVVEPLRTLHQDLDIEIRTVKTSGDRDQRAFGVIGGKGLFVAEVEREVAEGRADLAVHSAKDLTSALAPGCAVVCIPARAHVHDVVVGGRGPTGEERLANLAPGATVGTSSMRRRALLAEVRPDLEVAEFRGNLDTRLDKVRDGVVDAAVLAAAGIERLGADRHAVPAALDPDRWIPAPGQGALAVEALRARDDVHELFAPLIEPAAWAEVMLERAFAGHLEGGCSVPMGCYARATGPSVVATGWLGLPDGSESIRDRISGPASGAEGLGRELAEALLRGGGRDILAELRTYELPKVESP